MNNEHDDDTGTTGTIAGGLGSDTDDGNATRASENSRDSGNIIDAGTADADTAAIGTGDEDLPNARPAVRHD